MRRITLILLLLFLSGCADNVGKPEWIDYNEEDYSLMETTRDYKIYERNEYLATPVSVLYPFSDTCGVTHNNDLNYLLYYEEEFHSLSKGIEESFFTGEELVELGVEGIHCG